MWIFSYSPQISGYQSWLHSDTVTYWAHKSETHFFDKCKWGKMKWVIFLRFTSRYIACRVVKRMKKRLFSWAIAFIGKVTCHNYLDLVVNFKSGPSQIFFEYAKLVLEYLHPLHLDLGHCIISSSNVTFSLVEHQKFEWSGIWIQSS